MIPKIIHYCWFGGNPLPKTAIRYIETWKKYNPDYIIKEWNENNFDIHCCRYVEEAYNAKKWAFVSDYARFFALYKEGGIYLDTDIEVLKPFDDLLNCGAFWGFGWETLTLPVFGASKGLECYKKIIDYYNTRLFVKLNGEYDLAPIETVALKILQADYALKLNGEKQTLKEDIIIYPKEYFCSTKWATGEIVRYQELYVIHYAEGSWLSEGQKSITRIKRVCQKIFGRKIGDVIGTAIGLIRTQGFISLFGHGRNFIIRQIGGQIMQIISNIYINNEKIIFDNFLGRGYGDNPKYIAKELLSRNLGLDIVWIVKESNNSFPKGIRTVNRGSFREIFELASAGIWVDNVRKEEFVYKNPKQFYIQTWHGFYPLKKMEKDAIKTLSEDYIRSAIHDASITNLMVSGCKARTEIYRKAFWYDGEILECGLPRNDIFFTTNTYRNKIKIFFKLQDNVRIVLYAPTFRDNGSTEAYNIDMNGVIHSMEKRYGGKWVFLVRLHPIISEKCNFINYNDEIVNACSYDDIQELFAASDFLITDYSDCMFEFSISKKPVLLYAPDLEEYTKYRSFYYDIRKLPYSIATDNELLKDQILQFDDFMYQNRIEKFFNTIGMFETGQASNIVVNYIIDHINMTSKNIK